MVDTVDQELQQLLGVAPQSTGGGAPAGFGGDEVDSELRGILGLGPQQTEVEEPGVVGEFSRGVGRGVQGTIGLGAAAVGQVASALGAEETSRAAMEQYDRYMAEAQARQGAVPNIESIENMGDFTLWAAGVLGEQVPTIATILAGGGIGGLATKAGIKLGAREMVEAKAKQLILKGAAGGAFAASAGLGTGEIASELDEAGEEHPLLALGGGAVIGALELLPVMQVAKVISPKLAGQVTNAFMRRLAGSNRLTRAAAVGGLVSAQEAGTEALQELVVMAARDVVDQNFDTLGPESASRLMNAAAAGALGGGVMGAAGGLLSRTQGEQAGEQNFLDQVDDTFLSEEPPEQPAPIRSIPVNFAEVVESKKKKEQLVRDYIQDMGVPLYTEVEPFVEQGAENVEGVTVTPSGITVIRKDQEVWDEAIEVAARDRGMTVEELRKRPKASQPVRVEINLDAVEQAVEGTDRDLLSTAEQTRLSRLVEKESGKGLTDAEYVVLDRLLEKATGSKAEADTVLGWYAEDDRGTLYGPMASEEEATRLTRRFQGKNTVEGLQIESLSERRQMEKDQWVFQPREDAEALEEALQGTKQRRGESVGRDTLQAAEWTQTVQNHVQKFMDRNIESPLVVVLSPEASNIDDSFMELQGKDETGATAWQVVDRTEFRNTLSRSKGMFIENAPILLNADNLVDLNDVDRTLVHEVVVHEGLRRFMSPNQRRAFLDLVLRDVDVAAIAQEYGLDPLNQADMFTAAEEYVARLAEVKDNLPLWRRVVALIKSAFRKYFPNMTLTDDEIRLVIRDLSLETRGRVFGRNRYQKFTGAFSPPVMKDAQFQKWFGKSEIRNEDGTPQRWWHRPGDGLDFYRTAQESTSNFLEPVYISAQKVLRPVRAEHRRIVGRWASKNKMDWVDAISAPQLYRDLGYDALETVGPEGITLRVLRTNQVRNALGYSEPWSTVTDGKLGAMDVPVSNVAQIFQAIASNGQLTTEMREALAQSQSVSNLWKTRAMKFFLSPLQIAQRANLPVVTRYMAEVERMWNTKSRQLHRAQEVTDRWMNLGPQQANALSKVLFEADSLSTQKLRKLTPQELQGLFAKHKLDDSGQEVWGLIDSTFRNVLPRIQRGLIRTAIREETGKDPSSALLDGVEKDMASGVLGQAMVVALSRHPELQSVKSSLLPLALRVDEIGLDIGRMMDRNYFPQVRFGKYALLVTNNTGKTYITPEGQKIAKGKPVYFETAESVKVQQQRFEELKREFPNLKVQSGKLGDEEFSFLGFPPGLMDQLMKDSTLKLTVKQKAVLKEIFLKMSPGKRFQRSLTKRKGIKGFSHDAMRVFSSYMMDSANHLARVEHYQELQIELEAMRNLAKGKTEGGEYIPEGGDFTGMGEIRDYFLSHFDHLMHPGNDWAHVRSIGFMWYLGANPKSAFVNMTQVPMVTYPYLASRFGDARAVKELGLAYKTVASLYTKNPKMEKELSEDLARAVDEGFVDESLATEQAGIAESPALLKMLPGETGSMMLNKAAYYGSWMFHQAEKLNRRVAFVSAWRLAKNKGMNREAMFQEAKASVQNTQYEYAKWNRVAFMRGKQSILFLFWQYMQNTAYVAFGGQGQGTALRLWAMLFMMAGVQGLPFAENAFDLLDGMGTKLKQLMGLKNPRVDLKEDIRQLVDELGANPDWVMHGLSRYWGLGPLHMLNAIGVPIPNVDVSASLGAGQMIPGIADISGMERDPDKRLARTLTEMGGPVIGIGYNFWRLAFEQHPDRWKAWERAMPTSMKNFSHAMRTTFRDEGKVRLASGAELHDYFDGRTRAEQISTMLFKGLSFSPTEVGQKYEKRAAQEEMKRYWLTRRAMVLQNVGYNHLVGDREGVAEAKRAMRRYNQSVPHGSLRITNADLGRSLKARTRHAALTQNGIPGERRFRQAYREVGKAYPVSGP